MVEDSDPPPMAPLAKAFFLGLASAMYSFLHRAINQVIHTFVTHYTESKECTDSHNRISSSYAPERTWRDATQYLVSMVRSEELIKTRSKVSIKHHSLLAPHGN